MLKLMGKKILQFYAENFRLSKPVSVNVSFQGYSSGSDLSEGELEKQRRLLLQQLEEHH